jgi:single-stranded DNA-binding protein
VVCRLHLKEWTGREGARRSKVQVVADAVQFLDRPKKTGDPGGAVALADKSSADKAAVGAYRRKER